MAAPCLQQHNVVNGFAACIHVYDYASRCLVLPGRSSRQVAAISEKLVERVKTEFHRNSKIEGKETGDWVLIDTGDVIVHVFRPEVREFYQLEKMWLPTCPKNGAARV